MPRKRHQPGCPCCGEGGTCQASVCFSYTCPPEPGTGTLRVTVDGVEYTAPIERGQLTPMTHWSSGCVGFPVDTADFPISAQVVIEGLFPGVATPQTVEISTCGAVFIGGGSLASTFVLRASIQNLVGCPERECPAGALLEWTADQSDDGTTWEYLGAGNFTSPECTEDFTLPLPTRTQVRIRYTVHPPAGWYAWMPQEYETILVIPLPDDSCEPQVINIAGAFLFDHENYVQTRIGPVPKTICWSGNAAAQLDLLGNETTLDCGGLAGVDCGEADGWALAGVWGGEEVWTTTTRSASPFGASFDCREDSEATAEVRAIVAACLWVNEENCWGRWSAARIVPACVEASGIGPGTEEGGPGDLEPPPPVNLCAPEPDASQYWLCRPGERNNPIPGGPPIPVACLQRGAVGVGPTIPQWGEAAPFGSSGPIVFWVDRPTPPGEGPCEHAPHPRCHAPIEAYESGGVFPCGGMSAAAPGPLLAVAGETTPVSPPPRTTPGKDDWRDYFALPGRVIAAGCGRKLSPDEQPGCGCQLICLRGRSPRESGGVSALDCWRCPERPGRAEDAT